MRKKLLSLAAALVMPVAVAVTPPELQEGLWQIHMQSTDNPGNKTSEITSKVCRDHAYDASAVALAKNMKGCTTISESMDGAKYSIEMRCTVGGTVIDSKGTVTFQGNTSTHGETHATYTPAFYGNTDETMIQDQKYLGSCPAGMQPGDRMSADGTIQHRAKH